MAHRFTGGGAPVARPKARGKVDGFEVTRADGKTAWVKRRAIGADTFAPELSAADCVTPVGTSARLVRRYWGDDGMWFEVQGEDGTVMYVYGPSPAAALAYG